MPTQPTPLLDARGAAQLDTLFRRALMRAGNLVNEPVSMGVTLLDVVFEMDEQDASYGVSVTPNWNTDVWVTNKTVSGYRINFSAAAPGSAFVDSTTFRKD